MPRINHNISAMITSTSLADVDRQMASSLQKLSTGLRINSAADDAAGLSISNQLQTQVTGLAQGQRNAQDGSSLVTIADGALNEVQSILQRMRELSIESANDTLTSVERGYTETEFDQLRAEIDRIVGATQFNSMNLLDGSAPWGSAAGGVIHVGPNNTANDVINITIAGVSTGALLITGTALDKNGVADNVFITDQVSATNAISSLDFALQSVNTLRSNLGAIANRLADAITNQENQQTNMTAAESTIRDVDFATETTEFTREQILSQSSTAMLAQANQLPQSVLTLLNNICRGGPWPASTNTFHNACYWSGKYTILLRQIQPRESTRHGRFFQGLGLFQKRRHHIRLGNSGLRKKPGIHFGPVSPNTSRSNGSYAWTARGSGLQSSIPCFSGPIMNRQCRRNSLEASPSKSPPTFCCIQS